MAKWKQVNAAGTLYSITAGDRAGRVEKDGGQYEARIGRRRGKAPRLYWTWSVIGRFNDASSAKAAVEIALPQLVDPSTSDPR
ncbi:MAG: hypothetical protein M0R75_14950 [Dehalococcoidia bacterium]|nr:hypothetical protein [Dehalococcoidia bacterium]